MKLHACREGLGLVLRRRGRARTRPRWRLTSRAPVRGAIGVALPPGPDERSAPPARPPGSPISTPRRARPRERRGHQPVRLAEHRLQVPVRDVPNRDPRRKPHLPEHLGRPHVPDPGHELLALEGLCKRKAGSAAQPVGHRCDPWRALEDVGAQPAENRVAELQNRAVPLQGFELARPEQEPWPSS